MNDMAQDKNHIGLNLDTTDAARVRTLEQKSKGHGLQEGEKEELKQLKDKGARGI